jgi:biopolymer transport protein ExbB
MNNILVFLQTGGIIMFPLSVLAIALLAIIIDKILFYYKYLRITKNIENLIYEPNFCLQTWQNYLQKFSTKHFYYILWQLIKQNKNVCQNNILLENQATSLLKKIEKQMFSAIWILETIVSVAPLLGLLGTIVGMSTSFKILGSTQLNPAGITSGVAESLIATAFGLVIAIIALFVFNLWQRLANHTLDNLEIIINAALAHKK